MLTQFLVWNLRGMSNSAFLTGSDKKISRWVFRRRSVWFSARCSVGLLFHPLKADFTLTLLTWRIWWAPNNANRLKMGFNSAFKGLKSPLTLTLLTWRIWWAPINASKWQMGFNSAFKGLNPICHLLALLGTHLILHVSGIRSKTIRKAMLHLRIFPVEFRVRFR